MKILYIILIGFVGENILNVWTAGHTHNIWANVLEWDYLTAIQDENINSVYGYRLNQNFPNPFNPATRIKYQIQRAGRVELSVFNNLGQKIKTLVSEEKSAGSHTVKFDACGLASGIYYYQMKADDFIAVKKMLLVR